MSPGKFKNDNYFSKDQMSQEANPRSKLLNHVSNFARIQSWKSWIWQCIIPIQNCFSFYLFVVRFKENAIHVNSGHNISKKRFCVFINRPNVVKENAFSEAGFCTLATSNLPVVISTGKNLVLWNFTYFNVVYFCVYFVVRNIFLRKVAAVGKTSGFFCEPLTKKICICMCTCDIPAKM